MAWHMHSSIRSQDLQYSLRGKPSKPKLEIWAELGALRDDLVLK